MDNELMKPVDFGIDKNKSILLMWSGGYDSTLLLIEAMRQGYRVDTLYIELENNFLKNKREKYKRFLIKEKLENKFSNTIKDKIVVQSNIIKPNYGYSQPSIWLTQSLLNMSETYDYLCLGYLRTSDFWHIRSDWEVALKSLQNCMLYEHIIESLFPLEWNNKQEVHDYFKNYYKKIYDMCHTCENPVLYRGRIIDCNECSSCKNKLKAT